MRIVQTFVTLAATLGFAAGAMTFNTTTGVAFCDSPPACAEIG